MMSLKPVAVVVVAAAVTGGAVVGMRRMRASGTAAAQTISRTPIGPQHGVGQPPLQTSVPPRIPIAGKNGPSRSGPSSGNHVDDGGGDNFGGPNGPNGPAGPGRTRIPGHRQDRVKNGSYMTIVAGYYTGTGSAEVTDDKVSLKANLVAPDGRAAQLCATNLVVDGPYFYGTGTILDEVVQVSGRLDAARASRLVATFTGNGGHDARIVGNLPAAIDAGDDHWDEPGGPIRAR
jgi:hypothetical protein